MSAVVTLFVVILSIALHARADETTSSEESSKLLFVAELCRHGDRTPLKEFPSDSLPVSHWPEGVGQLTAIGQRAHYELGQRLRERYVDSGFLSSSYSASEIYVRSTDIDRTLMSAQSQLTGLYPPGTAKNDDVRVKFGQDSLHENEGGLPHLFQPIPIHTVANSNDMVLLPGANCPRHHRIMEEKFASPEFNKKIKEEADFLRTVGRIAQVDDPDSFSIFDVESISDTWTVFAAHSVPLPDGATPDVVSHAQNLSDWLLTFGNEGLEVHRLRAGLILNTVLEHMGIAALKEKGQLPPLSKEMAKKFLLLSAHDTTLAATLAALRVFDGIYPPYNSTIIWELHQSSNGTLFVRVEYNGKPLVIPGCPSADCSALDYIASTDSVTVPNELDRSIECLEGFWRYASSFTHLFSRRDDKDYKAELIALGSTPRAYSSHPSIGILVFIGLACIVGLAGFISAWRARSRYSGYTLTPGDLGNDFSKSQSDPLNNRRILM